MYLNQCSYCSFLAGTKESNFYANFIYNRNNQGEIFKIVTDFIGKKNVFALPCAESDFELAQRFNNFYLSKVHLIRSDNVYNRANDYDVYFNNDILIYSHFIPNVSVNNIH